MKDNFIDSNIFLYAFSKKDEYKQKIASKILLENKFISVQVINEVSVNLLRKFNSSDSEIEKFILSCYERYEIINFDKFLFLNAVALRKRFNISYYDSLIVSAALKAKAKILYSEDMQHNLKIGGLIIINPFY